MKTLITSLVIIAQPWCLARNQAPATTGDDSNPATTPPLGQPYPRVSKDHRATARIKAHEAAMMELDLMKMPQSVIGCRHSFEGVGIKTTYYKSPATAHGWPASRHTLREFAPMLVKP